MVAIGRHFLTKDCYQHAQDTKIAIIALTIENNKQLNRKKLFALLIFIQYLKDNHKETNRDRHFTMKNNEIKTLNKIINNNSEPKATFLHFLFKKVKAHYLLVSSE